MDRIRLSVRDPAMWGLAGAAACGFANVAPWIIAPLTLALTLLSVVHGSQLIWRLMKMWIFSRRTEHAAACLVASFYLIVAAYVAGDLAHHIAASLA